VDPLEDAEAELHELERALTRVAGMVGRASPQLAREFDRLKRHHELVRFRLAVERRMSQPAAA
jgi:hypothetical protein